MFHNFLPIVFLELKRVHLNMNSVNQSTDSIASSVQRSGLSISVGDTKSIVLALQSLQEKIRKLEYDRNFHQEQCEQAHTAHEAYKREVEAQLDRERGEHRRREDELRDLISRANTERSRLQMTLEESRGDLGAFRQELDALLDKERVQAGERETKLRQDLELYKSDILSEKSKHEKMAAIFDQMKSERDIILGTNRRLENTIKELIDMDRRGNRRNRSLSHHYDPNLSKSKNGGGYLSPTIASTARDVRPMRTSTPQRRPSPRPRSAHHLVKTDHLAAIDEVYTDLEAEHRALNAKYKESVQRVQCGGAGGSQDSIHRIMDLVDQKAEQLRLVRATRAEVLQGKQDEARTAAPKGVLKAQQRGAIVNQLRSLFSSAV